MGRIILGIVAGFIAWSILWVGSDQLMIMYIPWYGQHQIAFERAIVNHDVFTASNTVLLLHTLRSVIISLISGYIAALVAGENRRSPLLLGILLLLFGIFVQAMAFNYLPIWYHIVFLVLLVPATIIGGKLRRAAIAVPPSGELEEA